MSSEPNVTTESLRTLHRIHRQLSDLRQRLARGPKLIHAHQTNVENQENLSTKAKDETKAARVAADKKQDQLKDGETKVEKLTGQLNTANTNREYQSFKEQIAATEMANSVLADEILEGLEKIDQLVVKVSEAEVVVQKAQQEAEKTTAEVDREKPLIEADIQRLEADLKEAEAVLPDDVQHLYQRVVQSKGEDALSAIEGKFCGGCYQNIPINMINELMLHRPVFCKACGRLLYLPENHLASDV